MTTTSCSEAGPRAPHAVPPPVGERHRARPRPAHRGQPVHRADARSRSWPRAQEDAALVAKGQELYNNACITCHGANLQGVQEHGPSLIGVGEAAVYFQVVLRPDADGPPGSAGQAQAAGSAVRPGDRGGPGQPAGARRVRPGQRGRADTPDDADYALRGPDTARGGELFRLNCASCHNFTGRGGALSSGKFAPILDPATDAQIYAAMLSGPQNMPKFSDRQLTPEEKRDIIAYIKSVGGGYNNNPGGNPLGGIGPVSEGLIAFIVGLGRHDRIRHVAGSEELTTSQQGPPPGPGTALRRRAGEHVAARAGPARGAARRRRRRAQPAQVAGARAPARRSGRSGRSRSGSPSPRCPGWPSSLAFLFWPYHYAPPSNSAAHAIYLLYTPIVGLTFGVAVLALGIAVIVYVKKFFPDEVSVQQRHDGPSSEVARKTVIAQLAQAGADTSHRPPLADHPLGAGRSRHLRPRARHRHHRTARRATRGRAAPRPALWTTGWRPQNGETVYLRRDTGIPDEISLVRPGGPGTRLDGDRVPVPRVRARERGGPAGRPAQVRQPGRCSSGCARAPR